MSYLGFVGLSFICEKRRGTIDWVKQRLYRLCATKSWTDTFNQAKVLHLLVPGSDHIPIFLELKKFIHVVCDKKFRFENSWVTEEGCVEVIRDSWLNSMGNSIQKKLRKCGNI